MERTHGKQSRRLEIELRRDVPVLRPLWFQARIARGQRLVLVIHIRSRDELTNIRTTDAFGVAEARQNRTVELVLQVQPGEHTAIIARPTHAATKLLSRATTDLVIGDGSDPGSPAGAFRRRDHLQCALAIGFGFFNADT